MSEELTFKDITQIALGGVNFNDLNIALLYAIIDLLLKKLNCENEKVTLSGVPAERLQELLRQSNSGPPLVFRDEKMTTPLKSYEKLDELEEVVSDLETGLENHIQYCNTFKYVAEKDSDDSEYDSGVMPCAILCDVEEPQSEMIGALLKNKCLFAQMNEFTKFPLVCRFNKLDIKFRKLLEDFEQYKIECESAYKRIDKTEELFVKLTELQKAIKENNSEFMSTVEEIQEVMDSKVNNNEMPPLKRSIHAMIASLANEVKYLKYIRTQPRALLCIAEVPSLVKISGSIDIDKRTSQNTELQTKCGCHEGMLHMPLSERLDVMDKDGVLRRSTMETVCFKNDY